MSERDRAAERAAAVADAMDDIAEIDAVGREHGGIDRAGVERIKERLLLLAERDDLFDVTTTWGPPPDSPQSSVSYRIAQNDHDELALYVQCVADGTSAPPHEHKTWAVIVGLRGPGAEPPVRTLRWRRRAAGAARGGGRAGQRGGDARRRCAFDPHRGSRDQLPLLRPRPRAAQRTPILARPERRVARLQRHRPHRRSPPRPSVPATHLRADAGTGEVWKILH